MAHELSPNKSVCILAIVVGCFAILWPNIFYPMFKSSMLSPAEDTNGCCDVLSDKDVNGVKLISELCNAVLKRSESHRSSLDSSLGIRNKNDIEYCRSIVLDTCGVDIRNLLKNRIQLNIGYKQVLEEMRTFNKSICLKYHFDINLSLLGAPHRVKKFNISSKYQRQERLSYSRPRELHLAFRGNREERPPSTRTKSQVQREKVTNAPTAPPPQQPRPAPTLAKKPPIPGMRPPIGGGGHVQSQKGSGTMGVLMPMYTIGIVIFFGYTIIKLICKKHDNSNNYTHDPEFCRIVFNNNSQGGKQFGIEKSNGNLAADPSPKLVVTAISSLLQEVNRDILEREARNLKSENFVVQSNEENSNSSPDTADDEKRKTISSENTGPVSKDNDPRENEQDIVKTEENNQFNEKTLFNAIKVNGTIQVVGMEVNESFENGQRWADRTQMSNKKSDTIEIVPQEIILPGSLPTNSQVFVSDAHTENIATDANSSSVILESKVTLNVISCDTNNVPINVEGAYVETNCDEVRDVEYENGYSSSDEHMDDHTDLGDTEECPLGGSVRTDPSTHRVCGRISSKSVSQESEENTD